MSLILLSSVLKINMLVLYHGKPYIKMPMWHYIMKSLYKSYPVEYTYCTGCPVHYHHMTATWLPPNCHQTATRLPHDCHMTAAWLPHDCHMTATWLPHDRHMTATWPPMTATWPPHAYQCRIHILYWFSCALPPHDHYMTATWPPHDCHMTATWPPHAYQCRIQCIASSWKCYNQYRSTPDVHPNSPGVQVSIPSIDVTKRSLWSGNFRVLVCLSCPHDSVTLSISDDYNMTIYNFMIYD